MNSKVLIINGPNLNLLGKREKNHYGEMTLDEIAKWTENYLQTQKVELSWYQSNVEGEIVTKVQNAMNDKELVGVVINPGAYSHTSVAILDALSMLTIPVVEVHLSCISKREEFRQKKITAQAAKTIIEGAGHKAYALGVLAII